MPLPRLTWRASAIYPITLSNGSMMHLLIDAIKNAIDTENTNNPTTALWSTSYYENTSSTDVRYEIKPKSTSAIATTRVLLANNVSTAACPYGYALQPAGTGTSYVKVFCQEAANTTGPTRSPSAGVPYDVGADCGNASLWATLQNNSAVTALSFRYWENDDQIVFCCYIPGNTSEGVNYVAAGALYEDYEGNRIHGLTGNNPTYGGTSNYTGYLGIDALTKTEETFNWGANSGTAGSR